MVWPLLTGTITLFSIIIGTIFLLVVNKAIVWALQPRLERQQVGIDGFLDRWAKYEDVNSLFDEQTGEDANFSYEKEEPDSYDQRHSNDGATSNEGNGANSWVGVLGVSSNANLEEIKAAWRKKVKQFHSDRLKGVEGLSPEFQKFADQKMAEINQAYADAVAQFRTS